MANVRFGDYLDLVAHSPSGITDRFVGSVVFDVDGNDISGSPVELTHQKQGVYRNSELTMPASRKVYAVHTFYSDSARTNVDDSHARQIQEFTLITQTNPNAQLKIEVN